MIQAVLLPLISSVLDRVIPDKAASAKAKAEIEAALIDNANKLNLAQAEINKVEAASRNIWVSGWRPFAGWACVSAFAWNYLGYPIVASILSYQGVGIEGLVKIPSGDVMELLMALLGMSGLRTFDKLRGLTK